MLLAFEETVLSPKALPCFFYLLEKEGLEAGEMEFVLYHSFNCVSYNCGKKKIREITII